MFEQKRLESCYTGVNGMAVHARVSSTNRYEEDVPLVLVHGMIVSSRYMIPIAEELASFCPVYAIDMPGFGRSGEPNQPLDLPGLAGILAAWLDKMNLVRPVLLGNSFGCQIIAEFAVRYPERASGIVLVGPTIDPQHRSVLQQLIRLLVTTPFEKPSLPLVELVDLCDTTVERALRLVGTALSDAIEEKLPRITTPTLVVRGDHDAIVSQRWAEQVAAMLLSSRLVVIPGGHALNYSEPKRLARLVRPFLKGCRQGGALRPPDG